MGRDSESTGWIEGWIEAVFGAVVFLLWCACAGLGGCEASAEDVTRTLEGEGFTDIEPKGYEFFRCNDVFNARFAAVNPQGERVEGTVCCGVFTDCTVRW